MNEEYSLARHYKRTIPLKSRKRFGRALLDALNACAFKTESTPFAGYRGFDIIIPAFVQKNKRYITLVSNKYSGEYTCEIGDDITELGVSKAIDYLLDHLNESAKKHYKRNLELARQVELARENIRTGNLYKAQMEELSVELHALDEQIAEALSEAG